MDHVDGYLPEGGVIYLPEGGVVYLVHLVYLVHFGKKGECAQVALGTNTHRAYATG